MFAALGLPTGLVLLLFAAVAARVSALPALQEQEQQVPLVQTQDVEESREFFFVCCMFRR